MPSHAETSALPRRHLVRQLRQLRREHAHLPLDEVAHQLGWNATKLDDLEHGDIRPRPQDVAALCGLYGADERTTASLVALATYTQTSPGWQTHHTPDPRVLDIYPQLREHAERILEYQPLLVPTLLQTEAYARLQLAHTITDPNQLERQVSAQLDDARLLTRDEPEPPQLHVVLDESVLRQHPDRPDVMTEQLHHLASLGELSHVHIRIVPFTAGPHPALLMKPFTVLDFPAPRGPAPLHPPAFTETGHPDNQTDTEHYRAAFHDLLTIALDEDATRDLLLRTAQPPPPNRVHYWA